MNKAQAPAKESYYSSALDSLKFSPVLVGAGCTNSLVNDFIDNQASQTNKIPKYRPNRILAGWKSRVPNKDVFRKQKACQKHG